MAEERTGRAIRSNPAVLRELTVASVTDLGPHARRVTLTGEQLGPFVAGGVALPGFASPGPEDHIKLVLPAAPGGPVVLPAQVGTKLVWPDGREPIRRDVSVRHFDHAQGELTVEVVHHDGSGPLSAWTKTVSVGDSVHLTGPRTSKSMPDATHMVLIGDLASLAAVARWTAETPSHCRVTVRVAVPTPADERPVVRGGDGGDLDLHWIHSDDEAVLLDEIETIELGDDPFVFVGAENEVAVAARSVLRDHHGLTARQFRCIGYWRAD